MIHTPERARLGVPAEADGVAQAAGEGAAARAVERRAQDGRVLVVGFVAGVAAAADRDVKGVVGSDAERAERMLAAVRQVVDDGGGVREAAVCCDGRSVNL